MYDDGGSWEHGEICWEKVSFWKGGGARWYLDVLGPRGRYAIRARETMFSTYNIDDRRGRDILDRFLGELIADGWEAAQARGEWWFSYMLRRRVVS